MTQRATHRQADLARALRAAAKAPGVWQVELLPSGAICIVPSAGPVLKQKRIIQSDTDA
jgi:hypothetical protein